MMKKEKSRDESAKGLSASFVTGAVALVFLAIGYQTALFVQRAAVAKIVSGKECPDTVFVYRDLRHGDVSGVAETGCNDRERKVAKGDSVVRKNAPHSPQAVKVRSTLGRRSYESFTFNPNTVSAEDLMRLGFSEAQARSIVNYRSKGGRFRRKADFAKSYVVSDSIYRRLEPYIDIPLIDLNTADSAAFETLPGIGPYFASKMVSYRERLVGYSFKEQLLDIYHFDEEKLGRLHDLVKVGTHKPYRLWQLPEDSLRLHPYIRSYAAHGIVLYRDNNPKSRWTIKNLLDAGIIKEEDAFKLEKCLIESP